MVNLVGFNCFRDVCTTQTNRAAEVILARYICDWFCLIFLTFFMILALGEQNCNSYGAFQANVSIEDARCRGTSL